MNEEYNVTDNTTLDEGLGTDSVIESISEDVSTDNGSNITVVINNPSATKSVDDAESKDSIQKEINKEDWTLVDVKTSKEVVRAGSTTGLKSVVLSVIGDYETITTDYTYQNSNYNYQSHSIDTQPDYPWMITAAIFLVCLYSMFRLYGLVFGKGGRR